MRAEKKIIENKITRGAYGERSPKRRGLSFQDLPAARQHRLFFHLFFFLNFAGKEGLHEVYNCKIEERLERTNW